MKKSVFLLIFAVNFLAANETKECICNSYQLTNTEKIVLGGLVGGAAIAVASYVLPAATIATLSARALSAAGVVANFIMPTTIIGKVCLGLSSA